MAEWGEAFSAISSGTGTSLWMVGAIVIGVFVGIILLGLAAWWWFYKKRWNLKAEIKLTGSGGNFTGSEWGKAMYNAKRGVCLVKRPGMNQRAVADPIFDLRKYIQGSNTVTFVQVTGDELKPVLNTSWEEYEEEEPMRDKEGNIMLNDKGKPIHEKAAMINLQVDSGKDKAWLAAWKQAAKQAYSLKTFFTQFQTPIAIAIVIIAVFVGFAMVWTRLGSICG